ncbi:MFS transporter [Megasphaera paucivorans]|uniref:Sugar phosphate permease n=1 Tax=Megasphaera paucivorans TaxID=349095 RepID=A0A1H0C682_9FIRM|nr:MFS transporter [Megasphaera paucivorans]SDN53378.1 Sugar phosphate permease [Megasphaera paucivorans]
MLGWKRRNSLLLVLWLVFFVAYMDRINFSIAVPFITKELGLMPTQVGAIMSAFFVGYGLCQIFGGILADKFGPRKTMTLALCWWSVFTIFTGMTGGFLSLLVVRALFGMGESMQPPASWKLIATWFPPQERVKANALNLCSIALGPAFAPLCVVLILQYFDWRTVFYIFSIPGFIMAYVIWKHVYNKPEMDPKMTKEEWIEITGSAEPQTAAREKVTFSQALKNRNLVLLAIIYFAFNIPFWGFLSWLPSYLVTVRHFAIVKMGITASIPFFTAFCGMLVSNSICNRIFHGNKQHFLLATWIIGAIFMYLSYNATNENLCILYLSLASAFGMFMCFGPFWSLPMETLSADVMGMASGFINTGGQIAGFVAPLLIGYLIQVTGGSYQSAFTLMEIGLVAAGILILFIKTKKVSS